MAAMTKQQLDAVRMQAVAVSSVAQHAATLVREIRRRDGEGNTIPEHLYSSLVAALRAVGHEL